MQPFIHINGWSVSSYYLINNLSFALFAIYFLYAGTKVEGIAWPRIAVFLICVFFVQIPAGAVIPAVYHWIRIRELPDMAFMAAARFFHSAWIFSLLFVIFYCRAAHWPVKRFIDHYAIGAGFMAAFGRIACFMQGCCLGKPTRMPWGVQFPDQSVHVHPAQLYHLFGEGIVIMAIVLYIQKHKKFEGQTFWSYIFLYSAFRFFIEFFRTNPVALLGLTHAQLFSVLGTLLSGAILYRNLYRRNARLPSHS